MELRSRALRMRQRSQHAGRMPWLTLEAWCRVTGLIHGANRPPVVAAGKDND